MKIYRNSFLFFIIPMLLSLCYAQQPKYYFSVGTNMVDDSFFSTYNPFNFEEQWNFGKPISAIKFGVDLDYRWIVEVGYSSNTYEVGKKVNGQILTAAKSFTSYDIQTKYYWSDENMDSDFFEKINPFVGLGVGKVIIDSVNQYGFNYSMGLMLWLFNWDDCNCRYIKNHDKLQRLGLLLQANGKSAFDQDKYGNLIEYQLMLVYKF